MQDFNSSTLLIFAHRGEAQAFLSQARALSFFFDGLFEHESGALILICGEGLIAARERSAAVLAAQTQIESVINLGIAGGLRAGLAIGEVHSIRTVYGEGEFKSYTSNDPSARVDVISAKERVLDTQKAETLDNFAPVVERELWAIAGVCALFRKSWYAYKLISDLPHTGGEICEVVKDKAELWSQQLLETVRTQSRPVQIESHDCELELGASFHLTTSLQRQLLSLRERLARDVFDSHVEAHMTSTFERPKERTLALIQALKRALNPFKAKLEDELELLAAPLEEAKIKVNFDWPLERPGFNLRAQVQDESDLVRIATALHAFPFERLKALVNVGKSDV